jgi:hypothetical protein
VESLSEAERAELSPSEKYDILIGRFDYPFTVWQRKNTSPSDDSWWGICHGWAPAAYAFREPKPVVAVSRDGIRIPFGSSDVKALLSFHQAREGRSVLLGQRCNADLSNDPQAGGSLACRDTNAGSFHIVLANQIGKRHTPFVLDVTRDLEVWNQPIVSYESKVLSQRLPTAQAAPGTVVEYQITTDVAYVVEMAPSWTPHVGIDNALGRSRYVYYIEVDAAGRVVGGSWVSEGRPDFLWQNAPVTFSGLFSPLQELYKASVGANGVVRPPVVPVPRPVVVDARCPVGGSFDSEIGFCTTRLSSGDIAAIGPFTVAMTDLCEQRGGGESCRREMPFELPDRTLVFAQRWDRDFTARIRGPGLCALGSSPLTRYGGYCVETAVALDGRVVRNAYGPFSSGLVEKCIQSGGGTPCLTQRWDADFLLTLL